ncbi:MFS transporter [Kineobactrum sediminis]|uniref:MFS transporter n=1 Tax=Kineobactrum sediminis TaxID=1905677 RepID=UPI0019D41221|nr:MFS transporter [Kineobactrum sediminis]
MVAFGFVEGTLNFVAGRLAERIGRKKVLLYGWLSAIPIPVMVLLAPSWGWIVAATVLLGVNQGLCWSMTQTAKMDITPTDERGLTMGLNEFSGYVGVAGAGIVTGYLAIGFGPRMGLFLFGTVVIGLAIVLTLIAIRETHGWAKVESARHASGAATGPKARLPRNISDNPTTRDVFTLMSWRDLGYGIGALAFGIIANVTGVVTSGFWFVAIAMFLSGSLVMLWGEETHPSLNPQGE